MDRERMQSVAHSCVPCRVAAAVVGIALLTLGTVALARSGLDGPLTQPVVSVAGFDHNAVLGFVEVVAGALLVTVALSRSSAAVSLVSILIGVGALVALIEPSVGHDVVPIGRALAGIVLVAAATVAAIAEVAASGGAPRTRSTNR